jgi:hypothetical protein
MPAVLKVAERRTIPFEDALYRGRLDFVRGRGEIGRLLSPRSEFS